MSYAINQLMNENKYRNDSSDRVATALDVRLLVLDIDGTIVDQSHRIRDSVVQAVKSAQRSGVAVAIATGRSFQSSLHAYHSIGSTLPLVCYEGALIREPNTGFAHRHWSLAPYVAARILNYVEKFSFSDHLSVHFHIQDTVYVSNLNDASIKFCEGSNVDPIVVSDLRQLLNRPTTKVMVLSDDAQILAGLSRQLKNSHSRTRVRHDKLITFLEAFNPAVNKRVAVSYLVDGIMALRPENVMAIGDDSTDIEVLRYAGIGVAMGNAPVAVKAVADAITATVEEDGVAQAIERWILARSRLSRNSIVRCA